jgi:hypothetical protein
MQLKQWSVVICKRLVVRLTWWWRLTNKSDASTPRWHVHSGDEQCARLDNLVDERTGVAAVKHSLSASFEYVDVGTGTEVEKINSNAFSIDTVKKNQMNVVR